MLVRAFNNKMDGIRIQLDEIIRCKLEIIDRNKREMEDLMFQIGFGRYKLKAKSPRLTPRNDTKK
jgi:hypothetical protein